MLTVIKQADGTFKCKVETEEVKFTFFVNAVTVKDGAMSEPIDNLTKYALLRPKLITIQSNIAAVLA